MAFEKGSQKSSADKLFVKLLWFTISILSQTKFDFFVTHPSITAQYKKFFFHLNEILRTKNFHEEIFS